VKDKVLIVVAGPTAVGKTRLAIDLALHFHTEVISADARQLFREMTIGTAKPTAAEVALVKHHFIDSHSVHDTIDAAAFADMAMAKIEALFQDKKILLLCGGSGLYIKALLEGFDDMPEVKVGVRDELNWQLQSEGIAKLQAELAQSDPQYYAQVDKQNPQRLVRALEIIRSSGKPFSTFRKKNIKELPFQVVKIGLELPREVLYARIDARMDAMIEAGLFGEAERLHPLKNLNALQTVGYQEIFGFLDGEYDREEAVRLLKQNSRHYAKRQLTWFKKDLEIRWFSLDGFAAIVQYIHEKSGIL
jgi:tRNA dimethylallyltransferase